MMKAITFLLFVFITTFSFQQSLAEKYQYYFHKDSLKNHLAVLTSDSLTGRYTGTVGQQKAAAYIKTKFVQNGIQPLFKTGYYQPFSIGRLSPSGKLTVNNKELNYFKDYISFDQDVSTNFDYTEIVYISNSVKKKNIPSVKNKFILLTEREVEDFDNAKLRAFFNHYKEQDAAGIIFSTPTFEVIKDEIKKELTNKQFLLMDEVSRSLDFPLFFVSDTFKETLVFSKNRWKKRFVKHKAIKKPLFLGQIKGQINPDLDVIHTENIGGIIPAVNHKNGNKDHVVIMGHFDHLGIRSGDMFRGADDNGSGISSILEQARIFGLAKKDGMTFDRSIVFLAVSAEEIGLLGSSFYTKNPALPLENTNAVLNIDMVGRENLDTLDTYSLYLIGADKIDKELSEVNEKINDEFFGLHLDYRYNEEEHPMRIYYRSDHYNFVEYGVPSVFYFGGFHEDYHKPSDTADKINLDKLNKVSKFLFFTAWEIATNEKILNR